MTSGGIVLAGGKSSRMGKPKAWLRFGAELMLPRVVRLLREAVPSIVVVSAPGQDLPPLSVETSIVQDEQEGRGPLQGLAAGLSALRECADAAFVTGCDTPFLRPAFVTRMFDLLGTSAVCVPRINDHYHPLSAVYRLSVLDAVNHLLAANCLKVQELFDCVPTRVIVADELRDVDPTLMSLRNVNTRSEYKDAIREME